MKKIKSIRTKLILMILSANLLLVIPMIFFIQHSIQKEFETSLFYSFNQIQKLTINLLAVEKNSDEDLLNLLISDPRLQENLKQKRGNSLKLYLDQKRKELGIDHLLIIDQEKHLYTEDSGASKELRGLLESGLFNKVYTYKCAASQMLVFEKKLMRYSAVPIIKKGVIVGTLISARILDASLLKQITNNTDIELALLQEKQVMVSTLESLKPYETLAIDDLQAEWLIQHPDQSIKMSIGQGIYFVSTHIIQHDHLKRPILLFLAVKESVFYKTFSIVIKTIIITFIIALLIIAIFIIVLSHKIQQLFNEFVIFTQQIKLGDYETKIEMNTNDEFQSLAQNLEDMRQAIYEQEHTLQTYADTLGTEVDERTKRLRVQNSYLQTILDIQDELIIVINENGLTYANQACLNFWNVKKLSQLKEICQLYKFFGYENIESFSVLLKKGEPFTKNIDFEKSPDEHLFFEVKFYPIEDETDSYMVILNDVTAHAREKERLYKQATRDTLTNLPNRYDLENRLAYILEQIKRTREDAVFCLVDIDNFKSVNDTYGHLVGDQVLIKVATTLQENIRQSDLIARWGGEEFVIVLYPTTFSSARSILEMLRKKIQETFEVYSWKLTCSFGATVLMYDSNMDLVFKQADEALYEAKANGKNCVHFSIDIEG